MIQRVRDEGVGESIVANSRARQPGENRTRVDPARGHHPRLRALKSRDVEVETDHGRVMLTGVVRSKAERDHAVKAAAGVDGVTDVKDALVVR